MSLLKNFIPAARDALKSLASAATPGSTVVTLVSGNQSADLDSVCSAITYAFLKQQHHEQKAATSVKSVVIPLLNIPRQDLSLRGDVQHVLTSAGLDPVSLFFVDDLPSLPSLLNYEIVLVDHNEVQGQPLKDFIAKSKAKVVGIIDHHDDEGKYLDADPRIIRKSGSCMSLVLNYWSALISKSAMTKYQTEGLLHLMLNPILMDTSSMKQKVEEDDLKAVELIRSNDETIDEQSMSFMYSKAKEMKTDVSGLSVYDLLRKDYKEYELQNGNNDKYVIGMSSVVKSIKHDSVSDITGALTQWSKERCLDIAVMMTTYTDSSSGEFSREIAYFTSNEDKVEYMKQLIDFMKKELELDPFDPSTTENFHLFQQLNTQASRKQVAPLIKSFVESH